MTFEQLNLVEPILNALKHEGYTTPTPIQEVSIPIILKGTDLLGCAQTGTGKTAAFAIPILQHLYLDKGSDRSPRKIKVLIVTPTRELAIQIGESFTAYGRFMDVRHTVIFGGVNQQSQVNALKNGVDILVATPGRLLDLQTQGYIKLKDLTTFVLDEADRMLDMGFIPQVKRIVRATPPKENRQTLLFSATFNSDVMNLSSQWTCQPAYIEIEQELRGTESIDQRVYMSSSEEKFTVLMNLLMQEDVQSMIVFANRRDICRDLFEKLRACGISCGMLSGEVDQAKRIRTLDHFKSGQTKVLVATDVAGRGIHVEGISHVVNYALPEMPDDYVHRIGRTGRAGATGTSISFACEDDGFLLPEIEKLLDRKLTCEMPPVELLKALPADITLLAEKAEQDSRRERRTQFGKTNRGGARTGSSPHGGAGGPRSGGGLRGPGRTSGGNRRPTGSR